MKESWKSIVGYEGWYEVSNLGRVRRTKNSINTYSGRILKVYLDPKGYGTVNLSRAGVSKVHRVHRLVAKAFIPNLQNKPEINHKNGIKHDNQVENLEWCSSSENKSHALRTGLKDQSGEKNHQTTLSNKQVVEIRTKYSKGNITQTELSKEYGVAFQTISTIVRGEKRKKQGGKTDNKDHRKLSWKQRERDPITGKWVQ